MHKVPSLFAPSGSLKPAVDYFLANERELLDLLDSNYSFCLIYMQIVGKVVKEQQKDAFVDLVTRNLMYLMQETAFRKYLIIHSFMYGNCIFLFARNNFPKANATQRNAMIEIWKNNNPSALFARQRNFDVIRNIYPFATIDERKLLDAMIENDEFKSTLYAITPVCKWPTTIGGKSV